MLGPGLVHIQERWTDRASLDAHFASPHMAVWRALREELGVGERNLAIYELGEGKPL